jgi:hypothetical protein
MNRSSTMNATSRITGTLDDGVILEVSIEDLRFTAYAVVSEPDVNVVADFVPQDQFEADGDLHVAAVGQAGDADEQVGDVVFNMNPGDAAVFLCADAAAYRATLAALGQPQDEDDAAH